MEEDEVLEWIYKGKDIQLEDIIEKVDKKILQMMLKEFDNIAVFFCKLIFNCVMDTIKSVNFGFVVLVQ